MDISLYSHLYISIPSQQILEIVTTAQRGLATSTMLQAAKPSQQYESRRPFLFFQRGGSYLYIASRLTW